MTGTKTCTKCHQDKSIDDFYKDKRSKDGRQSHCKECDKQKGAKYYAENSEKINKRISGNVMADPDKKKNRDRLWYQKNKEKNAERGRKFRLLNPEKCREYTKKWESNNPDSVKNRNDRRRKTIKGRLENSIRAGVNKGIRSGTKAGKKTFELLGYSADDLRAHIESKFTDGMSWSNYGRGLAGWHIDHIIPLAVHNYETPFDIDFKRAWALGNLRPMWGIDNMEKGDRISSDFQPSFAMAA